MDGTVTNALSTEEKPIIENIISLFQQLLSMQGAGSEAPASPEVQEEMGTPAKPMNPEEDVNKSADGETGDDPAEKRIAEVTPTTDSSLNDLNKSINQLVGILSNKTVQKAQPKAPDQTTVALGEMAKVLKGIVENQNAQDQFNGILMNALGYSDEVIQKSLDNANRPEEHKPVGSTDANAVLKALAAELVSQANGNNGNQNPAYQHPFNQKKDVRKNLKGIAEYIHYGAKNATR